MRLIDADAITEDERQEHGFFYNSDLQELLDEQPTIEPQKWIPCNEITGKGFPKEDGNYYITEQNYGYYLEADEKQCVAHISPFRKGDFTNRFYDANHSNIVAWMPLPEPWKGEEE